MPVDLLTIFQKKHRREIKRWQNYHVHDIAYFNSKFDHLYKVVERVMAFTGRATGL
jgi:hypothetical protein